MKIESNISKKKKNFFLTAVPCSRVVCSCARGLLCVCVMCDVCDEMS